ncbi:NAD-dependent epimerase/dehydratase family protein [Micromonospora sp. 15K316]|uniref:NAD-dependent epimerase/dehydratase family protein n=1 Tax=Micromonospora sp. 15K316 TaxID=2530376 RepID=UPI00104BB4E6|nr:NAD-dependent epimerase/dehydratase family protein [Micromonospora sp. 15K316]TDC40381.1 NAD-dependent epimerase/dehydratase family protein [Micromonospora sp. 15K316]
MSAHRVVVTGGHGFVGSHLAERLLSAGADVTVLDSGDPPPHLDLLRRNARYVRGDVRDPAPLAAAITPDVDVVYHLAAAVGVDTYLDNPLDVIDINFLGTKRVLERATKVDARVVVASTSEIFGKNPMVPWREDADRVLGPTIAQRWCYSTSKALAEHLTFGFVQQHGLAAGVVRYFNVYGPRQRPAYVISRSVHRALNGRPPIVYDDGHQTRSFTYVADAVEGTILAGASEQTVGEAINLGSMRETSVAEAVTLVNAVAGADGGATKVDTAEQLGAGYQDLRRRVPDASRARLLLGWSAETELREGLTRTVAWARANPWWLALSDSGASR